MHHTVNDGGYTFAKEVEVDQGKEYQYKFRVGDGDWWELDEAAPVGMYSPFLLHAKRRFRAKQHQLVDVSSLQLPTN